MLQRSSNAKMDVADTGFVACRPYGSETVDPEESAATIEGNRKVEAAIGQRIKQAEAGGWMQLLRQFAREMDQPGRRGSAPCPACMETGPGSISTKLCRT